MSHPSVVLMSVDTLRFDSVGYQPERRYLSRYGLEHAVRTPNIDRLANTVARFTQAVSVSSYTTPAHASLLSGLYPPSSGVRAFYKTALVANAETLAARFRRRGYQTLALSDAPELFMPLGLFAGFQRTFGPELGPDYERRFLRALNVSAERGPVMAFVHIYDVHDPYLLMRSSPNPRDNDEFLRMIQTVADLYDVRGLDPGDQVYSLFRRLVAELPGGKKPAAVFLPYYLKGVTRFDQGRLTRYLDLFERLGWLDHGIVTLVSDHGEAEVDGHFDHWHPLVEELVRIPLLVHAPAHVAAATHTQQVSIVDVAPTLLELSGGGPEVLGGLEGRSLVPLLRGEPVTGDSLGYGEFWVAQSPGGTDVPEEPPTPGETRLGRQFRSLPSRYWWPAERMLRDPEGKVVVRGPIERLAEADRSGLSDREFVDTLFQAVYGSHPPPEQLEREVALLAGARITRGQLREMYLNQESLTLSPRVVRFDLAGDPWEERPIVETRTPREAFELGAAVATIAALSARARPAPAAFVNQGPPPPDDRDEADDIPPMDDPPGWVHPDGARETNIPEPSGTDRDQPDYSEDERAAVAQRLADLGYL